MSCGEYFAGVRPSERGGGLVVKLHEGEHLVGEVVLACERPVLEEATGEDGEEDLHLVEPACVPGGEDEAPARVLGEPVCYLLGRPGREVVADRDHLLPFGDLALQLVEEADEIEAGVPARGHGADGAGVHAQAGEEISSAVSSVLMLAPRRLSRPRLGVRSGGGLGLDPRLLVGREGGRPPRRGGGGAVGGRGGGGAGGRAGRGRAGGPPLPPALVARSPLPRRRERAAHRPSD